MIENEEQYKITEKWAKRFEEAAKGITGADVLSKAQRDGCNSMASDLRQQMKDYREKLKP